jgi:uncharacterized protein YgiB involved in biofilm formation
MPLLMGYMLGNMMGGSSGFQQPVYRDRDGNAVVSGGGGRSYYNVGSFGGASASGARTFRPATQITQVSRGGFGGTASAMRGFSAGS